MLLKMRQVCRYEINETYDIDKILYDFSMTNIDGRLIQDLIHCIGSLPHLNKRVIFRKYFIILLLETI